jgi:hypothetical protein
MATKRDDQSPLEQGERDTEIRRDTAVRGSMGAPASGRNTPKVTPDTDLFKNQPETERSSDELRGSGSTETGGAPRRADRLPLPD